MMYNMPGTENHTSGNTHYARRVANAQQPLVKSWSKLLLGAMPPSAPIFDGDLDLGCRSVFFDWVPAAAPGSNLSPTELRVPRTDATSLYWPTLCWAACAGGVLLPLKRFCPTLPIAVASCRAAIFSCTSRSWTWGLCHGRGASMPPGPPCI